MTTNPSALLRERTGAVNQLIARFAPRRPTHRATMSTCGGCAARSRKLTESNATTRRVFDRAFGRGR